MKVVTAHARQHACVVEERRVNQSIVRQKTSSNKSGTKTLGAVATRTVVVARPYCRLTQLAPVSMRGQSGVLVNKAFQVLSARQTRLFALRRLERHRVKA